MMATLGTSVLSHREPVGTAHIGKIEIEDNDIWPRPGDTTQHLGPVLDGGDAVAAAEMLSERFAMLEMLIDDEHVSSH
jgi:hypothetical protein